ncbi:ChaN family lipoprotein [Oscillatoriales cyanobacterium LEGE 11467]|uniref:ChaN family lipoprotein n=1 Tax=Zarconia navalis LEGE 11467 TaxID=1828826 RepID=A0A928W149_9CYAN|nr:ChaN family lipoprotein [Zarconia navalis]MBE9042602.1 ChaN family lipoprotein [Zarconia navalis LEGE 11467]
MKIHLTSQFYACSLGLVLLLSSGACARVSTVSPVPVAMSDEQTTTNDRILQELKTADIIYLGETHDRPADRQGQLEILEALHQENPNMAIALEMFQRPFQGVLDDYLAGNITEEQLRERTEYDTRWGFPWESYAPLLRFAKARQLPVLALNTPTEITRKVAGTGLESLEPADFEHIPPIDEIDTTHEGYRQMLLEVFSAHQHGGHGNSDGFERFFAAQVLWDETMAEKIAQFYQGNPDTQIVAIAGRGHIVYGYGIPSRVARRLAAFDAIGRSVLFGAPEPELTSETQTSETEAIADYFWFN